MCPNTHGGITVTCSNTENYYGTHPNGKRKTLVVGILLLVKEMQLIILILSPSMHQLAGSDLR